MQLENKNVHRLLLLNQKVKNNTASKSEIDEYMKCLYDNGSITSKQYNDYIAGRNTDDIIKASLVIGGILLFGYALSRIFK